MDRKCTKKYTKSSFVLKMLKVQLYDHKYIIASTQITNTEIFAIIAVLGFKLLSRKNFALKQKGQKKLLKSRLFFKKIASFTGKLLQKYK